MHVDDKMANELLKQVFQEKFPKIVNGLIPDSVIDALFSKNVICFDDYESLCQVAATTDRCRRLMTLLYSSSHPQTFIHLRLALLDEYSFIVDEIDQNLPSLISQLQHGNINDGTLC